MILAHSFSLKDYYLLNHSDSSFDQYFFVIVQLKVVILEYFFNNPNFLLLNDLLFHLTLKSLFICIIIQFEVHFKIINSQINLKFHD